MTGRPGFVVRPVRWKSVLGTITFLLILGGCIWMMLFTAYAIDCLTIGGPGCPMRRTYRRGLPPEVMILLTWFALPYFTYLAWRFVKLRFQPGAYLVVDEVGIFCREWPRALRWGEIEAVWAVQVSRRYALRPSRLYSLQIRATPDKEWYGDIGFVGAWRRVWSAFFFNLASHHAKLGRYQVSLGGFDQPPLRIVAEVKERAGHRFRDEF
jgi:hypothetical protein